MKQSPCKDCSDLQDLINRRSIADEQTLLDNEDLSLHVKFTRSGWRLDDVIVESHPGLSTVKAKHRGPEDGLWLLECKECRAFWQVHYAKDYGHLDVAQTPISSPEEWLPGYRHPLFYRGDGVHPVVPYLTALTGLASGLLAYWFCN